MRGRPPSLIGREDPVVALPLRSGASPGAFPRKLGNGHTLTGSRVQHDGACKCVQLETSSHRLLAPRTDAASNGELTCASETCGAWRHGTNGYAGTIAHWEGRFSSRLLFLLAIAHKHRRHLHGQSSDGMEDLLYAIKAHLILTASRQSFAATIFEISDRLSIEVVFGQREDEIGRHLDLLQHDMARFTLTRFVDEVAVPHGSFAAPTHYRVVHVKCLWS